MNAQPTKLERRLRIAGAMIIAGLLVELFSLRWAHPTAFLVFMIFGGTLIGVGTLFYLYSLVSSEARKVEATEQPAIAGGSIKPGVK
jgi:RsiW-degrading membrane proteinase PrsW (M82 family)